MRSAVKKKKGTRKSRNPLDGWFAYNAERTRRADGHQLYRRLILENFANLTISGPATHRKMVEEIAARSNRAIQIASLSDRLDDVELPRGQVVFGSPGTYLDHIAAHHGLEWWLSKSGLQIDLAVKESALSKFDELAGRLIVQANKGINGRSLRNCAHVPRIE